MGSCAGTLTVTDATIAYVADNDHGFNVWFSDVAKLEASGGKLGVSLRDGKNFNFELAPDAVQHIARVHALAGGPVARHLMLDIRLGPAGEIVLAGRFDAAQAERAQAFFDGVERPRVIDCHGLESISSAGLGVLLRTRKRALAIGGGLELVNVTKHIRDICRYSSLDRIFRIATSSTA